jgi:hypothetical protein
MMDPSLPKPISPQDAPLPVSGGELNQLHKTVENVALPIIAKIETALSAPLAPERVEKGEPFISAYSWVQEGESFVFKQVLTDEKIKELNLKQYPVLQMNFSDIKHLVNSKGFAPMVFLKNLGILIDTGSLTLRFPTKNALEGKLKELSIVQVSEILPFKEFLELMLTNDVIFSDLPHLIHDVCFHIIPLLLRLSKHPDGYKLYRATIVSTFRELGKEFEEAQKNFREFIAPLNLFFFKRNPIKQEEWRLYESVLQFSMGACLDILSVDGGPFLHGNELKKHLFKIQTQVLRDERWLKAWQKESEIMGGVLSETEQNRSTAILQALYARPFIFEVERIKDLLTEQLGMAKKPPEAFLASLNKRLDPPNEELLKGFVEVFKTIESSRLNNILSNLTSTLIGKNGWLDDEDPGSLVALELYRSLIDSLDWCEYDLFRHIVLAMLKNPFET